MFDLAAGLYANGHSNLDIYLKGHAGEPLKVDRARAGLTIHVARPALTIGIAIQPQVLRDLASQPRFAGRGLLARFAWIVPASLVGRRLDEQSPIPGHLRAAYARSVRHILDDAPAGVTELTLTHDARRLHRDLYMEVERQQAEGGDLEHLRPWASKLAGLVARIAGLLELAEHGPGVIEISAETMARAAGVGRVLIDHARLALGMIGADPGVAAAQRVLRCIRQRATEGRVTRRDVHRTLMGDQRFQRVDSLDAPLAELERRNYIRQLADDTARRGRPASPRYVLNPLLTTSTELAEIGRGGNCVNSVNPVLRGESASAPQAGRPEDDSAEVLL